MNLWKRWLGIVPDSVWWTLLGLVVGFALVWVGNQPFGVWVCRRPQGAAATFLSYHWSWVGWGRCVIMSESSASPDGRSFREASRLECQRFQERLEEGGLRCAKEKLGNF